MDGPDVSGNALSLPEGSVHPEYREQGASPHQLV